MDETSEYDKAIVAAAERHFDDFCLRPHHFDLVNAINAKRRAVQQNNSQKENRWTTES